MARRPECSRRLPQKLERHLDLARLNLHPTNDTEGAGLDCCARRRELRGVECVEHFQAVLEPVALSDGKVLENGQITVPHARSTCIGKYSPRISKSERRRLRKYTGIKPTR